MKRGHTPIITITVLILALFILSGCAVGASKRAEKESVIAEKVKEALESEGMEVEIVTGEEDEKEAKQEEETEPEEIIEEKEMNANLKDLKEFGEGMEFIMGKENPPKDVVTVLNLQSLFIKEDLAAGNALLDSEVGDYSSKNYFVVGSPCGNKVAAELLKKYINKKGNCHIFNQGEAWIRVVPTSEQNFAVYFGGDTSEETEKAAMVLGNFNYYALHGDLVRVGGTAENPTIE